MKTLLFLVMLLSPLWSYSCDNIIDKRIKYSQFKEMVNKELENGGTIFEFRLDQIAEKYKYTAPMLNLHKNSPWHELVFDEESAKNSKSYQIIRLKAINESLFLASTKLTSANLNLIRTEPDERLLCIIIDCELNAMPFKDSKVFDLLYKKCEGRYVFTDGSVNKN